MFSALSSGNSGIDAWIAGIGVLLALGVWIGWTWRHARLIAPSSTLYLQDRNGRFLGETGAVKDDEYRLLAARDTAAARGGGDHGRGRPALQQPSGS